MNKCCLSLALYVAFVAAPLPPAPRHCKNSFRAQGVLRKRNPRDRASSGAPSTRSFQLVAGSGAKKQPGINRRKGPARVARCGGFGRASPEISARGLLLARGGTGTAP
jgi:hypothetical protein